MAVNKVVYDGATLVDLTGDTVTADNLAAGVKATGADGKPVVGLLPMVTIDAELSDASENPVQNKIIYDALQGKANLGSTNSFTGTNMFSQGVFMPVGMSAYWYQTAPSNRRAYINDTQYTGNAATATKATKDGAGNVIVDTYAKKTELTAFGALNDANTWTGRQTFNDATLKEAVLTKARIVSESYSLYVQNGLTSITPPRSTMYLTATGATTLDMSTIVTNCLASNRISTIFTAYITSDADYTLTITNAGTIKYVGSASDMAITSAGLLLNIMLMKNGSGNVTSIVQASKLT